MMGLKAIVAASAVVGSLGAAALGLGTGTAQGKPYVPWVPDIPGIPYVDDWVPDVVPNLDAPGVIKDTLCPWDPPGHWMGGPHGVPCT